MYRVLVLTSTFPRRQGDTEPRFVLDLCRHLRSYADIRVVAPHTPGAALEETIDGVAVHRFRYFPEPWQGLAYQGGIVSRIREKPWRVVQVPFFLSALYRATRRQIQAWAPDVVHAHWIVPQAFVACLASRGRVPVVCTSHGGDLFGLQTAPMQRIKAWTLERCRSVTVVSESMTERVRQLAPSADVQVIPMGTDLGARFTPPASPDTRNDGEILFVGRLVEKKGVRFLIEALAEARVRRCDLKLTIVGDGPLRRELQRRVSDLNLGGQVHFTGSVAHAELPRYYRRAMLAVFPFVVADSGDQEGFGLVITEAMGCGCPVIASDLPAVRQSIQDGVNGVLTPAGDSEALARTICRYASDVSRRLAISAAALESARSNFDWPQTAMRYMQVIERACAGPKTASWMLR